ncbi:MAG TPA: hypothetical protein VGP83_17940 [Pyrinomonadaceae bacterium]|nr:hypothetical protein [Pyrinomonadaceae bacterium]
MGGVTSISKDQENEIRRYLFGQLPEADEERLEIRLLSEPSFVEEFDTVVDEVTDQYVHDELQGSERKGFEESYLRTAQGRRKLRFTSELLDRAANRDVPGPVIQPGFFDRVRAFWQVQSLRLAATAAALAMIAGGYYLTLRPAMNYATLALSISTANRGEGPTPQKVKLESGVPGVEVNLAIPEQAKGAKDYSLKLVSGDGTLHDLQIEKRDDQTLTVKIPASLLSRGQYAIQISRLDAGTVTRIPGNYYFNIE